MSDIDQKLLKDKRVVAEIERHLWIESEKAGTDVGFEAAKEDWLENFSKAWMQYHMPETVKKARITKSAQKTTTKKTPKRRRAKSYV
ncbi:MAG: hypothetical protein KAJ18_07275 [Candidatus Omnitrophica bacterium]|nr:hypothetical protein [Candidatus Omnitrophota bacterium]